MAFALLLAALLVRSDFAKHASRSMHVGAGEVFVLAAIGACLALFVFVLAFWQWRLSGRARVRLLLAIYLSLMGAFCGFCWRDVNVRLAGLPGGEGAGSALRQIYVETAAVCLTMGALIVGLAAVVVVLWLERGRAGPGAGA